MYQNNADKFARLRTIESGQTTATAQNVGNNNQARNWNYEKDGNVMGTITGFDSFEHPQFGEQHTVIVRLADTNELVSAFLSGWLQEGMRRQNAQVGDLILIQFLGKQAGERFNRFNLEIEKPNHDPF
ncbi:MAG: hypothetical protein QX189_01185 [Methylococcales bacterium]